jgi:PleD family two-component response regulator
LSEHVETCLQQRMYMDALIGMREMFYGSLYRGAGGWCTRRVLIVDDSKVIRNFLRRLMESGGYTTDVATNGGEALVMMQVNDICVC